MSVFYWLNFILVLLISIYLYVLIQFLFIYLFSDIDYILLLVIILLFYCTLYYTKIIVTFLKEVRNLNFLDFMYPYLHFKFLNILSFIRVNKMLKIKTVVLIDLITDSDAILKILSVVFCGKLKVNSDSSSKTV